MAQLPPWDFESHEVAYDYLHGYRLLDATDEPPEFPFGSGLSYTSFALGRLALDRSSATASDVVTVSVDIHNAGARAGDEVIQLYVGYPDGEVQRAKSELRGFRRVSLQPGEVKTVQLELRPADLAYFDEPTAAWITQTGEHTVRVGTSSRDLPLEATLTIE
jgi:beta-glucosidase